jgi:ABC-type phosphate transport system substrate-binding protein
MAFWLRSQANRESRTVTQVGVAIEGLTFILINGSSIARCIRNNITGAGLTIDQLRWIYSNYTQAQLLASGWNANALGNADASNATHKWSELNAACPAVEIKLASPLLLSGKFAFFKETVLPNATEGIATDRPGAPLFTIDDDEEFVQYVAISSNEAYGDAITYFGYASYAVKGPLFYGVPIQPIAGGAYIKPTQQNVEDGLYTPLSRRIYMNFLDSALPLTAAFLSYGFNPEGIKQLEKTGYVKPELSLLMVFRLLVVMHQFQLRLPSNHPLSLLLFQLRLPADHPLSLLLLLPSDHPISLLLLLCLCGLFLTLCGLLVRLLGLCRNYKFPIIVYRKLLIL